MPKDTQSFRHKVAALKKAGLLDLRTKYGKKIDARSVRPTDHLKNGRTVASYVKKYDDVLSGKVTPVKVPTKQLKAWRKVGYSTVENKVLVPHSATERAIIQRGEVVIESKAGLVRVQIPIPFHNLEQYLTDIKSNAKVIDSMKSKHQWFGFKFFGNSSDLYSDIDLLISHLQEYKTVTDAKTRQKQQEVYQNFELIRVKNDKLWEFRGNKRKSNLYRAEKQKRFRKRLKRKPQFVQDKYRESSRERMIEYRERLKRHHPTLYKRNLAKDRKRAKKNRDKKTKS